MDSMNLSYYSESGDVSNSQDLGDGQINHNYDTKSGDSIKVLVRVRPLSENELEQRNDSIVYVQNATSLTVTNEETKKTFQCAYDSVLGPESSQSEVYNVVKSCTECVLDGINSTIFAYGQTGSGKTYSMYGPPSQPDKYGYNGALRDTDSMGLIPRAVHEIFEMARIRQEQMSHFNVYVSFVQIYNESLFDMLRDASMTAPLQIREERKEIYVQGLSEYNVKSVSDTLQLLRVAEENRAIRETHMNQFSSRSHSIFQIFLESKRIAEDGGEISLRAKFNLVDLAGSEKWNMKQNMEVRHITEMTNINLSLHTLGKCISSLAKQSRERNRHSQRGLDRDGDWEDQISRSMSIRGGLGEPEDSISSMSSLRKDGGSTTSKASSVYGHVPYRDSKLTRLLQDSLGGNARTFLIATISPARANCEESISTLKFADRAKQVMVQAVINETRPVDHALVQRLQHEVLTLKTLLKKLMQHSQTNGGNGGTPMGSMGTPLAMASVGMTGHAPLALPAVVGSGAAVLAPLGDGGEAVYGSTGGGESFPPSMATGGGGLVNQLSLSQSGKLDAAGNKTYDFQYVKGLEKALKKEQVYAQHLGEKNDQMLEELERLRQSGSQADGQPEGQGMGMGVGQSSDDNYNRQSTQLSSPVPNSSQYVQIDDDSFMISNSQGMQVMDSVKTLVDQNNQLFDKLTATQKIMKKFFKFQIEEDAMKDQVTAVFGTINDMQKVHDSTQKQVMDEFSFLQFAPTVKSPKEVRTGAGPGTGDARKSTKPSKDKDHRNDHEGPMANLSKPVPAHNVPSMPAIAPNSGNIHYNSQLAQHQQQPRGVANTNHPNTYPNPNPNSSSNFKQEGRAAGSDGGRDIDRRTHGDPYGVDVASSGGNNPRQQQHQQQLPSGNGNPRYGNAESPSPARIKQGESPTKSSELGPSQHMAFRMRGGGAGNNVNGNVMASANSLGSSGGWMRMTTEEEEVEAEEKLKKELRKARKKQQKQQQLKDYKAEKEEKQKAELRAYEEERMKEQEAEEAKELKRKEYIRKQKMKLNCYSSSVGQSGAGTGYTATGLGGLLSGKNAAKPSSSGHKSKSTLEVEDSLADLGSLMDDDVGADGDIDNMKFNYQELLELGIDPKLLV